MICCFAIQGKRIISGDSIEFKRPVIRLDDFNRVFFSIDRFGVGIPVFNDNLFGCTCSIIRSQGVTFENRRCRFRHDFFAVGKIR